MLSIKIINETLEVQQKNNVSYCLNRKQPHSAESEKQAANFGTD